MHTVRISEFSWYNIQIVSLAITNYFDAYISRISPHHNLHTSLQTPQNNHGHRQRHNPNPSSATACSNWPTSQ